MNSIALRFLSFESLPPLELRPIEKPPPIGSLIGARVKTI